MNDRHAMVYGMIVVVVASGAGNAIDTAHAQEGELVPAWIKQVFIYYANDQISEAELIAAITYLVNNDIIQIDRPAPGGGASTNADAEAAAMAATIEAVDATADALTAVETALAKGQTALDVAERAVRDAARTIDAAERAKDAARDANDRNQLGDARRELSDARKARDGIGNAALSTFMDDAELDRSHGIERDMKRAEMLTNAAFTNTGRAAAHKASADVAFGYAALSADRAAAHNDAAADMWRFTLGRAAANANTAAAEAWTGAAEAWTGAANANTAAAEAWASADAAGGSRGEVATDAEARTSGGAASGGGITAAERAIERAQIVELQDINGPRECYTLLRNMERNLIEQDGAASQIEYMRNFLAGAPDPNDPALLQSKQLLNISTERLQELQAEYQTIKTAYESRDQCR